MEIRPVSYREVLEAPNTKALLSEYGKECSIPQIGNINPQPDLYARMEASGNFRVFGVFCGDQLAGFGTPLIYVNPHYGRVIATVESLFLAQDHRNATNGKALMNAIEDYARGRGCEAILYSARTGSRFEKLLSLLKEYERTNSVFLRRLQK